MESNENLDALIEKLANATYGETIQTRDKHVFKEAVLGLIRLAKAEQMRDIRINIAELMPLGRHDLHSYSEVD